MGEKPILFSGPMVRAILEGRKTQTRRVVKRPSGVAVEDFRDGCEWMRHTGKAGVQKMGPCDGVAWRVRCPYGGPGDRLYVRERFAPVDQMGHGCATRDAHFVVFADGAQLYPDGRYYPPLPHYEPGAFDGVRWKPSIHMPRWASRITLDVVSVRVERLQDITEAAIEAEGVTCQLARELAPGACVASPFDAWRILWESINGARPGCSWADDPWVWVVEFRRVAP